MGKLILITGGARSGKSKFAQELAGNVSENILFVATAEALDGEMQQRITEHRKTRPGTWQTLEASDRLGEQINLNIGNAEVVIIDCITLLLNNIFTKGCKKQKINVQLIEDLLDIEMKALLESINHTTVTFIAVTNEVGSGIVPDNEMARLYRDLLGKANRILAQQAEEVYMMIAGIPLKIK